MLENIRICYNKNDNYEYKKQYYKRKKFTPEEDKALKFFVYKTGSFDWKKISEFMPGRTAKQCRDRYCNYLSETIIDEPWSKEEDDVLLYYLSFIGPKWVEISRHIPGRSGSNVKNRWHKHLCKIFAYIPDKINMTKNGFEISTKKIVSIKDSKNIEKKDDNNVLKQYSIESLLN